MKKYSVIIPFHSNANLLTLCLEALNSTLPEEECEIIIVDNNSNGSQIPAGLSVLKRCRIIYKKENLLYPRAVNLGAENANGKYLILCDADTRVTQGFFKPLTSVLDKESIGYSSCKLLNMQDNSIQEFGITSSFYNFPHPYSGREINFPLCGFTREVMAGCAACSAIRKDLFYEMNGFDEKLIHSYSGIDLCLRLKDKGYHSVCVTDAVAYHKGSSTTGSGMSSSLKEDTKGIFMSKFSNIVPQIDKYLNESCIHFLSTVKSVAKTYLAFDCSTIGDSDDYIRTVAENLSIRISENFRTPYSLRDAQHIDLLNFIPFQIRNYRIPILYFVDSFRALRGNRLWKICRNSYADIVVDRHANILMLSDI